MDVLSTSRLNELVDFFKFNKELNHKLYAPLFLNYCTTDFDHKEKQIIILGEQHQGANINGVSYSKSNRTLVTALQWMIKNYDLKEFYKEGISDLEKSEEANAVHQEHMIMLNMNPLEIIVNKSEDVTIKKAESYKEFIRFSIISYLQASLEDKKYEMERIYNLITQDLNFQKMEMIHQVSQQVYKDLRLGKYRKGVYINEIKLGGTPAGDAIKMNLYKYAHFNNMSTVDQNSFKMIILMAQKQSIEMRDRAICENINKAMTEAEQKTSCILLGTVHLNQLKELFEEKGFGVALVSPFV